MAVDSYIQVDQARQMGALAGQIRDLLVQLMDRSEELHNALGQAATDDHTSVKLQTILGTTTPDNAVGVMNLVGSVYANLHDSNNAFLQYASRINRNF